MISVIICSRTKDIPQSLKDNIAETIGIEYELIVIDNSKNKYSIFSAYNEGVKRTQYSYLCFMHEDILFHTFNWGQIVVDHFKDSKVGLIGVVGGHYLPVCPASWWDTECRSGIIIQGYYDNEQKYITEKKSWFKYRKNSENSISVAAVDGLWFCIPKNFFNENRFDDSTFTSFHCYDLDICMQINKLKLEVQVIFDILIEHRSSGIHDCNLSIQKEIFFKKWYKSFPLIRGIELTKSEINDRLLFVENMNSLNDEILKSQNEIKRILNSKAYRLGKLILKPFSQIRNKIG